MESSPHFDSRPEVPPLAPDANAAANSSRIVRPVLLVLLLVALVAGANHWMVGRPVATKLASDERNAGFDLAAHYQYFLNPGTLVLDLKRVDAAAPLDLLRGLFQAAAALHAESRHFDQVLLCRSGKTIYLLDGVAFGTLGAEFAGGQNPVYLIRTLPQHLRRPDGTPAFGEWQGGLLGVVKEQMEDVSDAAHQWAQG